MIPVTPRAPRHAQPIVHLVRDGRVAEPAIAGVVGRLDIRHPVRAGVIAVVPAVRNGRIGAETRNARDDLLRERIVRVAEDVVLQNPRVHLPPEPNEALHRVDLFIRLRRLVLHAVVDVVDRRFGAPVIGDLRAAGECDVRPVVGVVRIHAAFIRAADGQADVAAIAAARHRDVRVDHETRVPKVAHVVRVRLPRTRAEELVAGMARVVGRRSGDEDTSGRATIELRPPTLIRVVIDTAAVTIDEVELTIESLAVAVLVVGKPQRRLHVRAERGGDAETLVGGALPALGRVHDRAVGRARAVQRRRVWTLQHRYRCDVVGADIRRGVADVVTTERAAAVAAVRGRGVVDRNAVDDDQRLVLAQNRARAADHDARRAERTRRARYLHAGDFAAERRHHVVGGDVRQLCTGNGLRGEREAARLPFDAQRRHDDLGQLDGAFCERDVLLDGGAGESDGHRARLVADATDGELHGAAAARREHEAISAVVIRRGAHAQRGDTDDRAGERRAPRSGFHLSGHRRRFLRGRGGGNQPEQDEPECEDGTSEPTFVGHTLPPSAAVIRTHDGAARRGDGLPARGRRDQPILHQQRDSVARSQVSQGGAC